MTRSMTATQTAWNDFVRKWKMYLSFIANRNVIPTDDVDTSLIDMVYTHRPDLIQSLWMQHQIQVFPSRETFDSVDNRDALSNFPSLERYKAVTENNTQHVRQFMDAYGLSYDDMHNAVAVSRAYYDGPQFGGHHPANCETFPLNTNIKDVCFNENTLYRLDDTDEIPPAELFLLRDRDSDDLRGHCITIGDYIRMLKETNEPTNPWTRTLFKCPVLETHFYKYWSARGSAYIAGPQ